MGSISDVVGNELGQHRSDMLLAQRQDGHFPSAHAAIGQRPLVAAVDPVGSLPTRRAHRHRSPCGGLRPHRPVRSHDALDMDAGQVRKQDVEEFNRTISQDHRRGLPNRHLAWPVDRPQAAILALGRIAGRPGPGRWHSPRPPPAPAHAVVRPPRAGRCQGCRLPDRSRGPDRGAGGPALTSVSRRSRGWPGRSTSSGRTPWCQPSRTWGWTGPADRS